jgi:hypothetical protein
LLQAEGASTGEQTRTRRLKRDGVDVDQLEEDLVTDQSMRAYLIKYRDVEYSNGTDPEESATKTIHQLQSRVRNIAESELGQLRFGEQISLGELRVIIIFQIFFDKCQIRYIASLLSLRWGVSNADIGGLLHVALPEDSEARRGGSVPVVSTADWCKPLGTRSPKPAGASSHAGRTARKRPNSGG